MVWWYSDFIFKIIDLYASKTKQYHLDSIHLLFKQHDAPAGLDGADFSVFVHGDHQQAIHHPLLPLRGVHQQVSPAERTGSREENVHPIHSPLHRQWFCLVLRCGSLPLLEEGEADTDGHVVDTQRNGVSLLWTVLREHRNKHKITNNTKFKRNENPSDMSYNRKAVVHHNCCFDNNKTRQWKQISYIISSVIVKEMHRTEQFWCWGHHTFPGRLSEAETPPAELFADSPLWLHPPGWRRQAVWSGTERWWQQCWQHPSGSRRDSTCERPLWSATPERRHTHTHTPSRHWRRCCAAFLACLLAYVLPFLQTPHTGTQYQCTWSSSSISPAVCLASLTTQTVWRERKQHRCFTLSAQQSLHEPCFRHSPGLTRPWTPFSFLQQHISCQMF